MKHNTEKKSPSNIIIDVFAWLSFVFALIMVFAVVLASFSDEQNGKEIFGVKLLLVKSDSMSKPNESYDDVYFYSGDLIFIKSPEKVGQIKAGDVITFISFNKDSLGKTVSHKVREVKYSQNGELIGYVTYGIKKGVDDQALVKPESVIGVYQGKIPQLGTFFSYLKTPKGYFISILLPCALLIIFFSLKIGRIYERKRISDPLFEQVQSLTDRISVLEDLLKGRQEQATTTDTSPTESESVIQRSKISFAQKLISLEDFKQEYFNALHNELLSYKKVNSRISFRGISYRFGRKLLAKITVRGKTLKLHLALNVNEFDAKVYFQQDLSGVKAYQEVPFTVKVKSNRAKNNAIKLVEALSKNFELIKNDKYIPKYGIKEVKAFLEQSVALEQQETAVLQDQNAITIERRKIPFANRVLGLEDFKQEYFNVLHNELLSYKKVNSRISFKGVSYRFGRKLLAKITVRGKTLRLHLALDVKEFNQNVYFQKDLSGVKAYQEVPFTVKVKSNRAKNNAIKLVEALSKNFELIKNDRFASVNMVDVLNNYINNLNQPTNNNPA